MYLGRNGTTGILEAATWYRNITFDSSHTGRRPWYTHPLLPVPYTKYLSKTMYRKGIICLKGIIVWIEYNMHVSLICPLRRTPFTQPKLCPCLSTHTQYNKVHIWYSAFFFFFCVTQTIHNQRQNPHILLPSILPLQHRKQRWSVKLQTPPNVFHKTADTTSHRTIRTTSRRVAILGVHSPTIALMAIQICDHGERRQY